jgi:hypothetical protein
VQDTVHIEEVSGEKQAIPADLGELISGWNQLSDEAREKILRIIRTKDK